MTDERDPGHGYNVLTWLRKVQEQPPETVKNNWVADNDDEVVEVIEALIAEVEEEIARERLPPDVLDETKQT